MDRVIQAYRRTVSCLRRRSRAGFSLPEALVGAAVLGLALSSVISLTSQGYRYLSDIRATARSSQMLQQKMEDIRLMNWTQAQSLPASFSDPGDSNHIYSGTILRSDYDWHNGSASVLSVTLVVTWTNRTGQVRTNSLSTLVGNGGLNKYIF